jgi:transposase-like protein
MRHRYSAEQWADLMDEQSTLGLTVREFCDAIGVSGNTFYSWRRRLADPSEPSGDHRVESPRFLPVDVIASRGVKIDLPCGAVVRVPAESAALPSVLALLLPSGEPSSC